MVQPVYLELLQDAREIVSIARRGILARFSGDFAITVKDDNSQVTEADLEAEATIREEIQRRYPGHGIVGEEYPETNPGAEFRWVLDPIDGTNNFAHRLPTFGTIVGIYRGGEQIVGIIDHPALGLCYSAARGFGTFCNDERISIRDYTKPDLDANEIITIGTRNNFLTSGDEGLFDKFLAFHPNIRIFFDCFGHTRAVHSQAGAHICFNLNLWDVCASQVLTEEANGKFVQLKVLEKPGKKSPLYSVIFGKPKLVDLLLPHFS